MNREERAKQFAPFDALKGLQDALRLKEYSHERVKRGDMDEEKMMELSRTLLRIDKNDLVEVLFYKGEHTLKEMGKISLIDYTLQYLKINKRKIIFDDIIDIKFVD